jgi:hypothetical protein
MYLFPFFDTNSHIRIDSHIDFRRVTCYIFDFKVFVFLMSISIQLSFVVNNETLIVVLFSNLVVFAFLYENMKNTLF